VHGWDEAVVDRRAERGAKRAAWKAIYAIEFEQIE
jgi:hypothetical protein